MIINTMFYRIFLLAVSLLSAVSSKITCPNAVPQNTCVTFSVSSGTGCAWMCNYCANQLGTNNYYFIDEVCSYQEGVGCVGNPIAGKSYTCCSA
jgi:hypothetical protein